MGVSKIERGTEWRLVVRWTHKGVLRKLDILIPLYNYIMITEIWKYVLLNFSISKFPRFPLVVSDRISPATTKSNELRPQSTEESKDLRVLTKS